MTTPELEPMEPELRELIVAERAAPAPPPAGRARVSARLESTLFGPGGSGGGGGGEGASGAGSSGPGTAAAAGSAAAGKARLAAVFLAGGLVGGALVLAVQQPRVQIVERIVYAPSESATVIAPRVVRDPPSLASAPSVDVAASAAPPAPPDPTRYGADSLGAERAVLEPARTALGRRDGSSALDAVKRHEARFPNGKLEEEREAIAVQALVLLHRVDEARARALRFHQRYPGSVLTPAVDAALGGSE